MTPSWWILWKTGSSCSIRNKQKKSGEFAAFFFAYFLPFHELRCHAVLSIAQAQEIAAGGKALRVHFNLVVTDGLRAAIQSVVDGTAQAECVITVSTVYVAGINILVDPANADEGAWLMAKDGAVAATPAIVANDAATMDLSFAALPPDGEYTLVIKARSGASTDFAPAVARRNVIVKAS